MYLELLFCISVAHFYLTRLLMPALTAAGSPDRKSRIVVLSSQAHRIGVNQIDFEGLKVYFDSNFFVCIELFDTKCLKITCWTLGFSTLCG